MKGSDRKRTKPPAPKTGETLAQPAPAASGEMAFSSTSKIRNAPVFLMALALIVAIVTAFAPVAHYDFISFDDPRYVFENRHLSGGLTGPGISWALTSVEEANWHP